jgi:hypothetical protein
MKAPLLAVLADPSDEPLAPDTVSVELEMRLVNLTNARPGTAWAQRARTVRAQHKALGVALGGLTSPRGPWLVRLHYLHWGKSDTDGLVTSFKGIRDGIATWLGVNDGADVVRFELSQSATRERAPYRDRHGVMRLRTVARVFVDVATDPLWPDNPSDGGP